MLRYGLIVILVAILMVAILQVFEYYRFVSSKGKFFLIGLFLAIAFGIGIFTHFQDKSESQIINLAQLFLQGKSLRCSLNGEMLEVDNQNFNFIGGAFMLAGKEGTPYFRNNIPLKACLGNGDH